MKILVCTDGSKYSQKALEQASLIADANIVDEVAIIHVYENRQSESPLFIASDKQAELIRNHFKRRPPISHHCQGC